MKLISEERKIKFFTTDKEEINEHIKKLERDGWRLSHGSIYVEDSVYNYNVIITVEKDYE